MRNDERIIVAADSRGGERQTETAGGAPSRQRVRGIAGQLRPYRDVRAGFEPWRRVALAAWAAREDALTVH